MTQQFWYLNAIYKNIDTTKHATLYLTGRAFDKGHHVVVIVVTVVVVGVVVVVVAAAVVVIGMAYVRDIFTLTDRSYKEAGCSHNQSRFSACTHLYDPTPALSDT